MDENIDIGKTIKLARIEKDLSQENLAEMLSVSKMAVSNWEKNNRTPSGNLLIKIIKLLDISSKLFPKTEKSSLEERVEILECEVGELKKYIQQN